MSSLIVWALGLSPVDETSSSSLDVCCTFLLELLFEAFNLSEVEKNKIKLGGEKNSVSVVSVMRFPKRLHWW